MRFVKCNAQLGRVKFSRKIKILDNEKSRIIEINPRDRVWRKLVKYSVID